MKIGESKGMNLAKQALLKYGGVNQSNVDDVFKELRGMFNEVHYPRYKNSNGRLKDTYEWAPKIFDMIINQGVYTDAKRRDDFMRCLQIFGEEHEQDTNALDGWTADRIINTYKDEVKRRDLVKRKELSNSTFAKKSDYDVVSVKNAKEAKVYAKYTEWCVTKEQHHYDSYAGEYGRFYFLLKEGFENVDRIKGDEYPLDEYGLSMIAVCVGNDGAIRNITTRWNHGPNNDIQNADNILTPKELSDIVGFNVYDKCKPYTKVELREMGYIPFEDVQSLLDSGINPSELFQFVGKLYNEYTRVKLNNKWNWIEIDNRLLSNEWFDDVWNFIDGFAMVNKDGKRNFIDTKGNYLCDEWFDDVWYFKDGFACVKKDGKLNWIDQQGNYLCDEWFDSASEFKDGFACVDKNGKYLYIDTKGKLYDGYKRPITESKHFHPKFHKRTITY